jgi:regulatory protein
LKLKLHKRGFPAPVISAVLRRLTDIGLLDDLEFARAWLTARLERHPEGRCLLSAGLKKRGVTGELARQAVAEVFTEERERECIRTVIIRKSAKMDLDPGQLLRILTIRGFTPSLVREILEDS